MPVELEVAGQVEPVSVAQFPPVQRYEVGEPLQLAVRVLMDPTTALDPPVTLQTGTDDVDGTHTSVWFPEVPLNV